MLKAVKARLKDVSTRVANFVLDGDAHDIQRSRQRRALEESVDFVETEMPMVTPFPSQFDLLDATLKAVKVEGLYCEFGVHTGGSINFTAERIAPRPIYGFDSFEGLPEDWRPDVKAGHFSLAGLPSVRDNVRLIKGWFNEALPPFLSEHKEPAAWLHIDSDLYSSARTVLELFAPRIRPGTVIVFDEYFNYPGWKNGEHKAFQEFVSQHEVRFEYLGFASTDEQVAVVVRQIG